MTQKDNILYVKGMNMSESDDDDGADLWDDRKLNDAYDKALKMAQVEVAKRVAMSTNNQNKNKQGKSQSPNRKAKSSRSNKSKTSKKEHNTQWKVGMPCRAVYEDDGIEYEAYILRIINDNECIVRFLGYENSEIVSISTLKPSLGKDEQAKQIEQALVDKTDEAYTSQSSNIENMESTSQRMPSPTSTDRSVPRKKKSSKKKNHHRHSTGFELPEMPFPMPNMSAMRNLGSMDMPLPPPPPLSLSNRNDSEDQAISSMLLSWYMSGYYTGLYQGMKRSKDRRGNM